MRGSEHHSTIVVKKVSHSLEGVTIIEYLDIRRFCTSTGLPSRK